MHKFSVKQKARWFSVVASILIIGIIGIFSSTAFATVQERSNDDTLITGKDIVGESLPLTVVNTATASEDTWGRIIRITGQNAPIIPIDSINSYFDIGVDDEGNLFINSPVDTKTSHSLMISPTGVVTINRPQL